MAAIAVPVLERTSQPYLRGLRHLDAKDFDRTLEPRVAQMQLDVRMIKGRLERVVGRRTPVAAVLGIAAQGALSTYELLCVSILTQLGMALPMAYYFHRATVMGIPANALAVPLTELLMPAAVLAVGYVSDTLAKPPAWLTGWPCTDHRDSPCFGWLSDRGPSCCDARPREHGDRRGTPSRSRWCWFGGGGGWRPQELRCWRQGDSGQARRNLNPELTRILRKSRRSTWGKAIRFWWFLQWGRPCWSTLEEQWAGN